MPILAESGLTTPQLATMEFARESRTVSEVATYLGLSRPATSQMIDKLVRAGLVLRTEDKLDRRERNIILSAEGQAVLGKIAAARVERFNASLEALSPEITSRFESILAEVIEALVMSSPPSAPKRSRSLRQ